MKLLKIVIWLINILLIWVIASHFWHSSFFGWKTYEIKSSENCPAIEIKIKEVRYLNSIKKDAKISLISHDNSKNLANEVRVKNDLKQASSSILSKKEALQLLSRCESQNNPLIVNENDGGTPSIGLFQWKTKSFIFYNNKYQIIPNMKDNEVMDYIFDPEIQTRLTEKVLGEKNGWRNWHNCLKQWTII